MLSSVKNLGRFYLVGLIFWTGGCVFEAAVLTVPQLLATVMRGLFLL